MCSATIVARHLRNNSQRYLERAAAIVRFVSFGERNAEVRSLPTKATTVAETQSVKDNS